MMGQTALNQPQTDVTEYLICFEFRINERIKSSIPVGLETVEAESLLKQKSCKA